jgi:hypothetical protein
MKGPVLIVVALALAPALRAQTLSLASHGIESMPDSATYTSSDKTLLLRNVILDSMQTGSRFSQASSELTRILRTNNPTANDPKSPYSVTLQNTEGKYSLSVEIRTQKDTDGEIYLVNVNGEKVLTLHKGAYKTGLNEFPIETKSLVPGLYYAVTIVGDRQFAEKIFIPKPNERSDQ